MENAKLDATIEEATSAGKSAPAWQLLKRQEPEDAVAAEYRYVSKPVYEAVKRVLDVVLSVAALIVLSPLMLVVSLLIVIDDPKGGPIFSQPRGGLHGKRLVDGKNPTGYAIAM